jgi:glycosyltransferase involved in cell wall biosynthesis
MAKTKKKRTTQSLKIALVHDFLREYGGAERVVEALHELFPDAPLYVAFTDPEAMGIHWQRFENWDIRQSWIAQFPFSRQLFSPLRILAPAAFRSFDLSKYDVVISSSNAYFAKAVKVKKPAVHICYCHTPPRSLYGYNTMTDWKKNKVIKFFGTLINHVCRVMDVRAAQHVDIFIANSREVQKRIQKFYRRDSVVINPPVDIPAQLPKEKKANYFLYVNRLAFSKHPELAVEATMKLKLPLKVVGTGKMLPGLQNMAGSNVEFLGSISDEKLHDLYASARALLYPVEDEDFGIVPVEAMGYGVPVIAHHSGGPKETIINLENPQKTKNATGVFFDECSIEDFKEAVQFFLKNEKKFNRNLIHKHAQLFDSSHFKKKILSLVKSVQP